MKLTREFAEWFYDEYGEIRDPGMASFRVICRIAWDAAIASVVDEERTEPQKEPR